MHLTGERPGERACPVLPLCIGAAVGAVLHELGRLRDLECPPGGDLLQMRIERVGGVRRVDQLGRGAPALARPLLKDADRVTVAIVDVVELGLLQGRSQRDRDRVVGESAALGHGGDGRSVSGLLRVEVDGCLPGAQRARRRLWHDGGQQRIESKCRTGACRGHDDGDHNPSSPSSHSSIVS